MACQIDAEVDKQRRLQKERRDRKRQEREDRRKVLGCWMAFSSDAFAAMNTMDRVDKELGAKSFIPLLLMFCATMAHGQAIPVLTDTNQLFLFPSVKVDWRTDLFVAETHQFVATNWVSVESPRRLVLPNGTLATLTKQEAHMVTNVEHRLTYKGETRIWKVSQTFGPPMETRDMIVAAPPEAPVLSTQTRQQR